MYRYVLQMILTNLRPKLKYIGTLGKMTKKQ